MSAHRTRLPRTACAAFALALLLGSATAPAFARPRYPQQECGTLQNETPARRYPTPGDPDFPEGPGRGSALQIVHQPFAQPATWLASLFAHRLRMRL
jgi:hypothetical protein